MYCENCGSEIEAGSKFCSSCGNLVDTTENPVKQNAQISDQTGYARASKRTGRTVLKKHCQDPMFIIGMVLFTISQFILAVSFVQEWADFFSESDLKELFEILEMADDLGVSIPVSIWVWLLSALAVNIGMLVTIIWGIKLAWALFNVFSDASGYEVGGSTNSLRNMSGGLRSIGSSVVVIVVSCVISILSMLWLIASYIGYDFDDLDIRFSFWVWLIGCLVLGFVFCGIMNQNAVYVMMYSRVIECDDAYFSRDYGIVAKNLLCGIVMIALVIYCTHTEGYEMLTEMAEVNTLYWIAIIISAISLILFGIKIQMIDTEIEQAGLR